MDWWLCPQAAGTSRARALPALARNKDFRVRVRFLAIGKNYANSANPLTTNQGFAIMSQEGERLFRPRWEKRLNPHRLVLGRQQLP